MGCNIFRHIYTHLQTYRSSQDAITEMARKALHRVSFRFHFSQIRSDVWFFSQLDVLCKWWFRIDLTKQIAFQSGLIRRLFDHCSFFDSPRRELQCQITMYDYMDFDEFLTFMTYYDVGVLMSCTCQTQTRFGCQSLAVIKSKVCLEWGKVRAGSPQMVC